MGEKTPEDRYILEVKLEEGYKHDESLSLKSANENVFSGDEPSPSKKTKSYPQDRKTSSIDSVSGAEKKGSPESHTSSDSLGGSQSSTGGSAWTSGTPEKDASLLYSPPDLNRNITEIFGKLINIYRALGDDRRSFSYYKAIPVIEKLPFKIESAEQVKNLPGIGKSLQDHIQEIVTTGKLSKLEHFEADEKVKAISLFGEVWGIGPATALKLYEKGHRTLDDLKREDSLTHSQKLGLKYFEDIRTRIPRNEVQEMEQLLQKIGEEVLPGGTDSGVDTYFGLCTYPGKELRHRIDFKVYPRDIYAFGLIAWTGNDVLNRRLRLLAESKGFRLDDTGLFPAALGSGGKRGARASATLRLDTEKEVFDFLGFPWLEPHERNL